MVGFIGYVQHSTFCDLGKIKKVFDIGFGLLENLFERGKLQELSG